MRIDTPVYSAEVAARTIVTPNMLRITLGAARADDGSRFRTSGRPDEFFGLWMPGPDSPPAKRYYSVRAWREEADEIDVDFVVHAQGPATTWARNAVIGDRVAFDAPRGHYAPPEGSDRVILVGDATALPAIGRILEERTEDDPAVVAILSVDDVQDRQPLPFRAGDEVRWVAADRIVAEALAAADAADAATYLWFSGEATAMRGIRRHVRHVLGWPRERYMTMGYWRRDEERWAAEFDRRPDLEARIAEIWESGDDDEVQRDRVDALLERNGL